MLKGFPELGPAWTKMAAEKNLGVSSRLLIGDAVMVPGFCRHFVGLEVVLDEIARFTKDNHRFRRRIAVTARPKRIRSTDRPRQTVTWPVEIDRAGFAIICSQNPQPSSVRFRQRVSNAGDRFDKFWPADLLRKVIVIFHYLFP